MVCGPAVSRIGRGVSRVASLWSDSRRNGSCGDTSGRSRPLALLRENAGVILFMLRIYKEHISDHLILYLNCASDIRYFIPRSKPKQRKIYGQWQCPPGAAIATEWAYESTGQRLYIILHATDRAYHEEQDPPRHHLKCKRRGESKRDSPGLLL